MKRVREEKINHSNTKPKNDVPSLPHLTQEFQSLDENGFMVIPHVISSDECDRARQGINQWFESIGVRSTHPEDWSPQNLPHHNYFMFQNFSVPFIQAVMDIRQHPAVHAVFSKIWGDAHLWSSLDAICVQPPYEWTRKPPPIPPPGSILIKVPKNSRGDASRDSSHWKT